MKKKQKSAEPSLFRKIVEIWYEQAKRRKALRMMTKNAWSYEFLCFLLIKSAKVLGDGVCMEIVNRTGQSIRLTYEKVASSDISAMDDSILDHLDDDVAVAEFIARNGRRH